MVSVSYVNRRAKHGQQGAVLLVTLIMLTLLTLVVFSTLRSSSVDAKIGTNEFLRGITFQAAESAVEQVVQSKANFPSVNGPPATDTFAIPAGNSGIDTRVQTSAVFKTNGCRPATDQSFSIPVHHFEVVASAETVRDTPARTQVVSGVAIEVNKYGGSATLGEC